MHTRDGFRQAFNGQAVVTSDQVIVAAEVVPDNFDFDAFHPMLDAPAPTWTRPGWQIRSGRSWPMPATPTKRTEPGLRCRAIPDPVGGGAALGGKKPAEGQVRKTYQGGETTCHEEG